MSGSRHPSWRLSSVLLVMISLSIGWGVRGNFGHEYGAMLPGVLAGMAACLMSGRQDWRRRVAYFAFFGALGWAFGGSFSYMKVVSYTHSGHLPSVAYGFAGLFFGSFLWAAIGGAATAYPAVETRERLTALFKPLSWVLAVWALYYFFYEPVMNSPAVVEWTGGQVTGAERGLFRELRQNDPFYWLDTDWVQALLALVALCSYNLWERRAKDIGWLAAFVLGGAAVGWAVQWAVVQTGLWDALSPWLVRVQGDVTALNSATGAPFDPANMITNWPLIFGRHAAGLGAFFGALAGAGVYFRRFGRWDSGASLLLHMTLGWFVAFLLLPVLLGIRMTPPRNDNWAGGLGVLLGIYVYMYRHRMLQVTVASIACGTIGGLGIATTQCLKLLLVAPGNPNRLADLPEAVRNPMIERWAHWQGANWHSIVIEQGAGLLYGLGLAVGMGLLATRIPPVSDTPRVRRWTEVYAVAFVLIALVYVNMIKCVTDWTTSQAMPEVMRMPLVESISLTARAWFNLAFFIMAACTLALLTLSHRRKLPFVPDSWLGRGQTMYFVLLWIIVTFNFMKALVSFSEGRIATEGAIFFNGVVATFLLVFFAREEEPTSVPSTPVADYRPLLKRTLLAMLATVVLSTITYTGLVRVVYGDKFAGHSGEERRFGDRAGWRLNPVLRDRDHP